MTYEERISRFMAAVRAEAVKQSSQINSATEDYIQSELAKAEEELRYETESEVRSRMIKLRREIGLSISTAQRAADAELYACRAEIEEGVFSEVRNRLASFRRTAGYDEYLTRCAEGLRGMFGEGDSLTLYYMQGDEGKFDLLKTIISSITSARFEIVPSDKIKLGGFTVECAEKKLAVDCTLDGALEGQHEMFRKIPELRVDIGHGQISG